MNQHMSFSVPRDEEEDGEDGSGDEESGPDEETRGDEKLHEGPDLGHGLLFGGVEGCGERRRTKVIREKREVGRRVEAAYR